MTRKIELASIRDGSGHAIVGNYWIKVGRELWGRVIMESHGPRGNSFTFQDIGNHEVMEKGWKATDIRARFHPPRPVTVRSPTRSERRAGAPSARDQLIPTIAKLIEDGRLRPPDVVVREDRAQRIRRQKANFESARIGRIERAGPDLLNACQLAYHALRNLDLDPAVALPGVHQRDVNVAWDACSAAILKAAPKAKEPARRP